MDSRPVWTHSPRRMALEVLERTFVGDERLATRLTEQVLASLETRNKHYNVLVGPSGCGKSHLLALVMGRVGGGDSSEAWCQAWLPDDPGGLAAPLHLYREILRQLGAEVPEEEGADRDRQGATDRARQALLAALSGRPLLLCVEQWDTVLDAFGDEGQRELRSFFQEERCCTLLATATQLTADFVDQERVFYGFFGVHRWKDLTCDDLARMLRARAEAEGVTAALTAWEEQAELEREAVVRALAGLLGSRPSRFVGLLQDPRDVADPARMLLRACDRVEAVFRARAAELSTQQRLILHWLTATEGAHPVKHVARACAISEQTVSPQLRILRDAGFVRATRVGRETWYEPCDPLWGLEATRAAEVFAFLQSWHRDPEQAIAHATPVAAAVTTALGEIDPTAEDPRPLLRLSQPLRSIAESLRGRAAGTVATAVETGGPR